MVPGCGCNDMARKSGMVVISCTASPEKAPVIAKTLVADRLIACANIMPVRSIYRWKGAICDEGELLLVMKTREENADKVIAAIREMHTYEVPEIIVLPVMKGHGPYLDWIIRETG